MGLPASAAAWSGVTDSTIFAYALSDFGPDVTAEFLTAIPTMASFSVRLSRNARPTLLRLSGDTLAAPTRLGVMRFSQGDHAQNLWQIVDTARAVRLTAIRVAARDQANGAELGGCTVLGSALPLKPGQDYCFSMAVPSAAFEATPLLTGFATGTRILTAAGKRRIEDLVPGDLIWTEAEGFQPLLWHGVHILPARGMAAPVRLRRSVNGPTDDLVLAAQQCVRVEGETGPVLVPAEAFVQAGRAQHDFGTQMEWHQLLLPGHALIQAQGLVCESLWAPGILGSDPRDIWPRDWPAHYLMPGAPILPRLSPTEGARLLV
jgi:hypothetical protein